jgi:transcriptional regulator with XRE-family HTH domain
MSINPYVPRSNRRGLKIDQTLINRVRKVMAERGLNVSQLTRRAGLGDTAVYDILHARNIRPSFDTVRRIAVALDVSLDYLGGLTNQRGIP